MNPAEHKHEPPPGDVEAMARLELLRADFPDWYFQYIPEANLAWEAKRNPLRFPDGGGIAWIQAGTAERLRDLLGGVLQIEAQHSAEETARRAAP